LYIDYAKSLQGDVKLIAADAGVILTVYNGEQFLEQAVTSIRRQTLTSFEFVIVDDGSTDHTPEILARLAKEDSRIKVIISEHQGRAKALNLAWRNTKSQFIANLDVDDLSEPDRLEKQVNFLQENPDIGLLGTAWNRFIDNDAQPFSVVHPPLNSKELKNALPRHYPFIHSSTMFTRRALEEVNGYNENYRVCIDYEISTRIACQCEVANLPDVLTWKRSRLDSFFSRISAWERYQAVVKIRWLAWSTFSRKIYELPYIVNGWNILKQSVGRHIYYFDSRFIHPRNATQ
jgi:glycosyltransferase involved in cell wall biosynthesis